MNVLILGAGAGLAPYAIKVLEPHYRLRLADIKPIETKHEFMSVDISSLEQVVRAAEGMDAIINLAVIRYDREVSFQVNTRGCYNMMRAAVEHGIRRVINTGPHFVLCGPTYEGFDFEISPEIPPQPGTNIYAVTKSMGQETCKVFTEHYDVHVLCYLFYHFRDPNDDPTATMHHFLEFQEGAWERVRINGPDVTPFVVTRSDSVDALPLGLEVDLESLPSKCEIFFICTDVPHGGYTNEKAKRLLGFAPKENLERLWNKAAR
jgi:nucleoside-diphosphate-sugar epimerase